MKQFLANYKNELAKLLSRKKYFVFMAIAAAICFMGILVSKMISMITRGTLTIALNGVSMDMLRFFSEIFVPLMIMMAICDIMATEIHDLTIKAVLMRPITRAKILLSKACAAFSVGMAFFVVVFVVSTLVELLFGSASTVGANFGASVASYLLNLVPLFILALFAMFINILCSGPTLSMLLCIGVYAILKFCSFYVPVIGNIVFTSFMNWQQLWVGHTIPFHAMISKIGLLTGWGIILFAGGYLLFDKKEF